MYALMLNQTAYLAFVLHKTLSMMLFRVSQLRSISSHGCLVAKHKVSSYFHSPQVRVSADLLVSARSTVSGALRIEFEQRLLSFESG